MSDQATWDGPRQRRIVPCGRPPLRIAFVTPWFSPHVGGLETHVERLTGELSRRGHTIEIFTQRTERHFPAYERFGGVQVRRSPGLFGEMAYPIPVGLRRAVGERRQSFDVVHAHSYHALAALAAMKIGPGTAPLIFTPHYHAVGHTRPAQIAHRIYRPIGRLLFGHACRVICVSPTEAGLVGRDFGATVAFRTVVIPNGVDVAALREAQAYDLDHAIVLSVGRLVEYKNLDRLIAAAQMLPAEAHVVIVGDGPDRSRLEALVARHKVKRRVTLLGRVSDLELRRWYRSAIVAVELSRHEAFGLAMLEALTAGARVIASAIPAHHYVSGLVGADPSRVKLVSPETTSGELARTIADALAEGRGAAPDLSDVATWPWVAEQTEQLYREALSCAAWPRPPVPRTKTSLS